MRKRVSNFGNNNYMDMKVMVIIDGYYKTDILKQLNLT